MRKYTVKVHIDKKNNFFVLPPITKGFGRWLFDTFFRVEVIDKNTVDPVPYNIIDGFELNLPEVDDSTVVAEYGALEPAPKGSLDAMIKKGYDKS